MHEHGGRDNPPCMVSAPKNLNVGAAGQSDLDANQKVACLDFGNGYGLYLQMFFAIEHGRHHLGFHSVHLCGSRIIFNDWESGCNAKSKAEHTLANGSRCETSKSTGSSPEKTSSTDCFCNSTEALYEPNIKRSPTQMEAPDSSIRSVSEVCANSKIRAPARDHRTACSTNPGADAARMTRSAPRPSVSDRTMAPTSSARGSSACSTPQRRDNSRRLEIMSVAMTLAPVRRTSMLMRSPIGPCPSTRATSPPVGAHCTTLFKHVVTVATNESRSNAI